MKRLLPATPSTTLNLTAMSSSSRTAARAAARSRPFGPRGVRRLPSGRRLGLPLRRAGLGFALMRGLGVPTRRGAVRAKRLREGADSISKWLGVSGRSPAGSPSRDCEVLTAASTSRML